MTVLTQDPSLLDDAHENAIDAVQAFVQAQVLAGASREALGNALLAYAHQLLAKVHGQGRATRILRGLADDLAENPPEPAPARVIQ